MDIQQLVDDVHYMTHLMEALEITDDPVYSELKQFIEALDQYESVRLSPDSALYGAALLTHLAEILEKLAQSESRSSQWAGMILSLEEQIVQLATQIYALPRARYVSGN